MRKKQVYQPGMLVRRRPHSWKSSQGSHGRIVGLQERQASGRICTYAIVQWREGCSTEVLVSRIEPIEEINDVAC